MGRLIRQEIQTNDTFAHVGSTEVTYDIRNNVTKVASEFGGYTAVDEYLYSENSGAANAAASAQDNLISRYKIAGSNTRVVDYSYDDLNRLKQKKLTTTTPIYITYEYKASDLGGKYTTTQLETEKLDNTTYKYYYDKVGNITGIDKAGVAYRSYTYDLKNQLTKEVNSTTGITTNFTYDAIGNISKKVENNGTTTKTINYRYDKNGKTGWNNLLTGVDFSGNGAYETAETISYDNIGNPTKYFGASLDWYGRQLTSYTVEDDTNTTANETLKVTYTYDADGIRGTKTVTKNNVDTKHTYHYVSGQLRYETRGVKKFYYFYDASGNLSAIRYYPDGGSKFYMYYTLTNQFGDIIALYDANANLVASYEYDAWGNCTIVSDSSGRNIGELNPIRYRGYYYDTETGLYYLQSRYYNPQVGRFISADSSEFIGTGANILCFNMYIYCSNNPIKYTDLTGCAPEWWQWTISGLMFVGGIALILTGVGTFAGGTFICAGVNSIIGSYVSEASGGSSFAGWIGGIVLGTICGIGMGFAGELYLTATELVGVSALNKLFACLSAGFTSGFSGAFASEFASAKIDNRPMNKNVAAYSAGMGLVTMIGGIFSGIGPMLGTVGSTSVALGNVLNAVSTLLSETVCDVLGGIASMLL